MKLSNQKIRETGDVWKLETSDEEQACDYMNYLYEQAIKGKVSARNLIKKCYSFDVSGWTEIKKKMETEGSVWYVWYMDGVKNLMRLKEK